MPQSHPQSEFLKKQITSIILLLKLCVVSHRFRVKSHLSPEPPQASCDLGLLESPTPCTVALWIVCFSSEEPIASASGPLHLSYFPLLSVPDDHRARLLIYTCVQNSSSRWLYTKKPLSPYHCLNCHPTLLFSQHSSLSKVVLYIIGGLKGLFPQWNVSSMLRTLWCPLLYLQYLKQH